MELNTVVLTGPIAASATVVLLRDGADGLEVFLQRRHADSAVLGGAYVFPGGKADPEDLQALDRLDRAPEDLHALLGEPELAPRAAAALFVTAIREVFEETGLLLATVTPEEARSAWAALRAGAAFASLPALAGGRLQASALQPWSRWITPTLASVTRKRFDTRFFIATVPAGQEPTHDTHEATESRWMTPHAALRHYWDGAIALAPPQILSLCHLARHRGVASVFAAARLQPPPLVQPEPHDERGERMICYPGDPAHSVPLRALPGPLRLTFRAGRFEPDGGLAGLLGDDAL